MQQTEWVDVKSLRYTQNSISNVFSDGQFAGTKVKLAAKMLREGSLKVTDFPPIRVVRDDCADENHYWCLDNRRLWAFRKARLDKVPATLLHPVTLQIAKEFYDKTTTTSDGKHITFKQAARNQPLKECEATVSPNPLAPMLSISSIHVLAAFCPDEEHCSHALQIVDTMGHTYHIPAIPAMYIRYLFKQHSLSPPSPLPHLSSKV